MIDWFWLWLGEILQRRQLRRVEELEEAANSAMYRAYTAEPKPEPCFPQDCDDQCPGAPCPPPEQLQNAFGAHDRMFAQLYGSQALRPQQLSALQQTDRFAAFGGLSQQQMQSARGFGAVLGGIGGAFGYMAGGPMGGAFGNAFGNLLGDSRKKH